MKIIYIIVFIILSTSTFATDYYLSSTDGDDNINNGISPSTPWKTINKINSAFSIINPGDKILFKRGDAFYGTLKINKSGLAGNPIYIGAYGTGAKPVISSFSKVDSWAEKGGGIYSSIISLESFDYIIVSLNGVNTPMGRYPDIGSTWLTIDNHDGKTSITDAALDDNITDWTGAELVIKENHWVIERRIISDHTYHTLKFSDVYEIKDNWGYFIQNDLRTLNNFGEWYYDGLEFYMYFGTFNPTSQIVKVSSYINGLIINSCDYITIENINFTGFGGDCISLTDASNITVQNCEITFCGESAIKGNNEYKGNSSNCIINNNIINEVNNSGISITPQFNEITISNNSLSNIGLIPGTAHYLTAYNGIYIDLGSNNIKSTIEYNTLKNIGYLGIGFYGSNITVRYNFVNNFCVTKQDGGGIYTYNSSTTDVTTIGYVLNNIVLNGIGNIDGCPITNRYAYGIYIDGYSTGITVADNTISSCYYNYYCNGNRKGVVINNTIYDSSKGANIAINSFTNVIDVHKDMVIKSNISVCKEVDDRAFYYLSSSTDIPASSEIDYNYYARPIDDNLTLKTYSPTSGTKYRTLAEWQSFSGQDANSKKSPIAITNVNDIRFEYNASKTNKVVMLDKPMIDVKGNKYYSSITLLPYTSAVLMVDPNPVPPEIPVYQSSVIENATPASLELTYSLTLANSTPAASAFLVNVNSLNRAVTSVAISGNKVILTLASPVSFGDVVTVAYVKPATNPLQTTAGGQAESFTTKPVTNNCAPPVPVFQSAVVENAAPSIIEISYDLSLASVVPATSAFIVQVNSIQRTVSSVAIVSGKVRLTLSSPVAYGELITVAYTKPATNPLQTSAGGQAGGFTAKPVTNNLSPPIPVFTSAVIQNATPSILEISFNPILTNIIPSTTAFNVKVNSLDINVSTVAIISGKVFLTLVSPVVYNDMVTVSYTKPSVNPLQSALGVQVESFSLKPVTNNVGPVIPVFVSAVVENATPSIIELTYDLSLTNIVPAASSFTVLVNSLSRSVSSVSIVSGKVRLTLSSPLIYGDVITVAYTRPGIDPLQTAAGGVADNLSAKPVVNNCNPPSPVFVSAVVENASPSVIEMSYNLSLAGIIPATSAFIVQVNSIQRTVSSVAIVSGKVRLTLASPVVYGDIITIAYTKPAVNPLQTAIGGQAGTLNTSPVTNNCNPQIPVFVSAVVENAAPTIIEMTYDLSLTNSVPPITAFVVNVNSVSRSISSVSIVSGKVRLTLTTPVSFGDLITVSYTKPPTNPLKTASGGEAADISNRIVTNNISPVNPVFLNAAVEDAAPSILIMNYDLNLGNIVPFSSAFDVRINNVSTTINSVTIVSGKVHLTLSSPVSYGDAITVSYSKPAINPLQTSSGGQAASISLQPVTNKLYNPAVPNNLPVIVIKKDTFSYSGFIDTLDASGSYDLDGETLSYKWITPSDIPVHSTDSSTIRFLAPVLIQSRVYDFTLNVSDGRDIQTRNISVTVSPYKPGLPMSKTAVIQASEYNAPNYPANIADGNINTRWSVNGDNQWLLFTMVEPFKISHIQLGLIPDQKYESYFDIYASKDNVNWEPAIVRKASCNFSGNLQVFDFPADKTNTDYSYVKLVGHGNAKDTWNNYSELRIFGYTGEIKKSSSSLSGNIFVYPNPARDLINVLIQEPPTGSLLFKIYDTTGALCLERMLEPGIYFTQIPLSLRTGNYVVQAMVGSLIVFAQSLIIVE